MTTTTFAAIAALALGAPLATGTFAGVITVADGRHAAVVLLGDQQTTEHLNWADAKVWADSVGGTLPTRAVAAMLFANRPAEFSPLWYWTNDTPADDARDRADRDYTPYAWSCYFLLGNSGYNDRNSLAAACAVQLLSIEA